ncbi:unnamed protein product [Rhizophagus irregularis]|nr:unnamed protein product [Rhizophagus irregularis]
MAPHWSMGRSNVCKHTMGGEPDGCPRRRHLTAVTRINQITNRDTGIPSIAFTRCTVYKKRLATNGCIRSYKITCHDFVLAAQNFISVVEYLALTFRHIVIYSTRI